ncbi:hypothetical protein ABLA30_09540 [Xenorhabdus nematophila]|uniref:DUF7823 domain-containing protein n=1 Tax=Xenorhabdus nematophila TaxID=628 RepID=UPI0032B712AD
MSDVNKSFHVDNMLVIDITLGASRSDMDISSECWGYSENFDYKPAPLTNKGQIVIIENNTGINAITTRMFHWQEHVVTTNNQFQFKWGVYSYGDIKNYQHALELFQNKYLYINVDGVIYNLGKNTSTYDPNGYSGKFFFDSIYTGDGAKKLGNIFKQTGVTKRFYINWK